MSQLFTRFYTFFKNLKNNIAFYPSLLAVSGFVFAMLMIVFEQQGISKNLIETMPMLVMEDGDTALTVLSVCIGGLISMMVFSFSMVMLLLSNASNNFSPRLLPGLISDKRHQIILGLYLATIIYNIFTMFSIESTGEKYTLPGFSVLLGILGAIVCLGAFIYFIHNISQSIQISMILEQIYDEAKKRLTNIRVSEKKLDTNNSFYETSDWYDYPAPNAGYFRHFSSSAIVDFCKDYNTKLHIMKAKGLFVLSNETFIKSQNKLDDEQLKELFTNIYFSKNELISDNYTLAFKQITEIAVKSMSPGINDPGTAINSIDYLTELLALRMQKEDIEILSDNNSENYCKIDIIGFKELLYNILASLRTYCKHDPVIVQKLLTMLLYLKKQPSQSKGYLSVINEQMEILLKDANDTFEVQTDKAQINAMVDN